MGDRTIILRNVRLAFPDLREAKQFEGTGPFNYGCTLLIEPKSENDKLVKDAIMIAAVDKWAGKAGAIMPTLVGSQKNCYVDGNTKEYDGFENKMALSCKRRKEDGAPLILDRDARTPLAADSGKPYAGCMVNCKVTLWGQDNNWGKGMRCTVIAVQFVGDGPAFSGSGPANAEGMEAVEEEATDLV